MKRRDLLGLGFLAASSNVMAKVAQVPTDNKLLFVFLRGGYDSANLLVPIDSEFYYESRPTIGIKKIAETDGDGAVPIADGWGLNSALRETILEWYKKGEAAFVPFAGIEEYSRSHFKTQDLLELAQPVDRPMNYQSGLFGRLVDVLTSDRRRARPAAFTRQPPVIFRGGGNIVNIDLNRRPSKLSESQISIIEKMYEGTELGGSVGVGFEAMKATPADAEREMKAASRNAMLPSGFKGVAETVAKLMRDQYSLGFIDVGGWDTHVRQGGSRGYLHDRFRELGEGLSAFPKTLGDTWKKCIILVVSEFGRTFRENGNGGTDHGSGTTYWILGGGVNGGKILGQQSDVKRENLHMDREFKILNSYAQFVGTVCNQMFDFSSSDMAKLLAGANFEKSYRII